MEVALKVHVEHTLHVEQMPLIDVLIIHVEEILKIAQLNHPVQVKNIYYAGMEDAYLKEMNV